MNNKIKIYKPEYEKFFYRAFCDYSSILSIYTFIFCNLIFIFFSTRWFTMLYINLILIFFFLINPLRYIYYLSNIKIKFDIKTIEYTIHMFDKVIVQSETSINDIEVKIIDHWFRRHTLYELKIYVKHKWIIKQHETKNWSKEMFEDIKKQINIIKTQSI